MQASEELLGRNMSATQGPARAVVAMQVQRTVEALKRNRFDVHYVARAADVPALVEEMLEEGQVVSCGGSMTLAECGVCELLESGKYDFIDHASAKNPDEGWELDHKALMSDVYFMSSNAITERGELYNVDGNCNRVAALCYGPRRVVVIAGVNKLVHDLDAAVIRMKTLAAPANANRLKCRTYCAEKGECVSLSAASPMLADGCSSPDRICCSYVVTSYQRTPGRVSVIIVGETLGF
jgi:hypothetical protein